MCPSVPSYPPPRASAELPAGHREYESFDNYESQRLVLAATTAFQEIISFSGTPESIIIDATAAGVDVRFRNLGEAAPNFIRLEGAGERRFQLRARIVEARDPTGAGGQGVTATGRYASRSIDVRADRRGPGRAGPLLENAARSTQATTPS